MDSSPQRFGSLGILRAFFCGSSQIAIIILDSKEIDGSPGVPEDFQGYHRILPMLLRILPGSLEIFFLLPLYFLSLSLSLSLSLLKE